ncbi:MAG TPA: hypothetical protein VHC73_17010 [Vitreimonas sp.]|nr:hypothetical protein [Vitreimonas sp.]
MILRRLTQNLREQNWTAITIEFLIVVLGVFIANQVTDWNAHEADKRRGAAYLQQLTTDVQGNVVETRRLIGYYEAVQAGAARANTLLQQPSPNPRELVINAYRASEYAYGESSRATWDEIISSGDIALIPNTVRATIDGYYKLDGAQEVRSTFSNSPYRQLARRLIGYEVQAAMRAHCSDRNGDAGLIEGFVDGCELTGVTDGQIAASAHALERNPQVLADLRYQLSDLATAHDNFERDITRAQRALAALRAAGAHA